MDVREKLIELLKQIKYVSVENAANILIANGVTVQEWIPASEPPKDTGEYWIAYKVCGDYSYYTGYFDGKYWRSPLTHHKIPVTHWMPIPQPPKGE